MEVDNILKVILFLTVSGASAVGFKVIKDDNITMPSNVIEIQAATEKIVEKAPEAAEEIWQENVMPAGQEMVHWLSANVLPKAEDFFEEEVKQNVEEKIKKQVEEIQAKATPMLSDIKDVIKGDKKCSWVCE